MSFVIRAKHLEEKLFSSSSQYGLSFDSRGPPEKQLIYLGMCRNKGAVACGGR